MQSPKTLRMHCFHLVLSVIASVKAKGNYSVPALMETPGFMNDKLSDVKSVKPFSAVSATEFSEGIELWLQEDKREDIRYFFALMKWCLVPATFCILNVLKLDL